MHGLLRSIVTQFIGWPVTRTAIACSLFLFVSVSSAFGQIEPTELFFRADGRLYRAVLTDIPPNTCATLQVKSADGTKSYSTDSLRRFMGKLVIPIIPSDKPQRVEITFEHRGQQDGGQSIACEIKPARHWRIHIIPHTHLDIGYTDLQENVWRELAENLDGVIDLCKKTSDWPKGSQYRWTIEQSSLFENFANRHPQHRVDELVELIREGRIELAGYWVNLLTELAGPEGLVRATYPARRIAQKYGLTVDTVMLNDVPGYTWCMPKIWTDSGIRYANLRANGARSKFLWDRPAAVPRPFRWQSPDGAEILCWYTDSYREANFLRRDFPGDSSLKNDAKLQRWLYTNIMRHLRRAAASGYRRDLLPLRMGGDNITAVESVCSWVRHWNQQWAYPQLAIVTNRQFFKALDDGQHKIPVLCGDIPDWWADGAASSAEQTGQARLAHDRAVSFETLCVLPDGPMSALPSGHEVPLSRELATVSNLMPMDMTLKDTATDSAKNIPNQQTLRQSFHKIHRDILLYDEHTWGASKRFWKSGDMKMVDGQWAVKRGFIDSAQKRIDRVRRQWKRAVDVWAKPLGHGIIVWNSLSWTRSDMVQIDAEGLPQQFTLRAPDGKAVPVCRTGKNHWAFVAEDVPSLGYAFYQIVPTLDKTTFKKPHKPAACRYEIRFDKKLGAVTQIIDRKTRRHLLQDNPRYTFNQYLYEDTGIRNECFPVREKRRLLPKDKNVTVAAPARLVAHEITPVFERIVTQTSGRQAPIIEQSYTVYPNLDWIDITNSVHKTATRDTEEVYFAFPLAVDSPQCRIEIPFGCMRPGKQQLQYSATDFYSIYHWVEMWNSQGGILWASLEAPLVVFEDLWPECWTDQVTIDTGTFFSYVMNSCWGTNYRFEQGGHITFRYRLRDYQGKPNRVRAFRFGHEACVPLIAQMVQSQEKVQSQQKQNKKTPSRKSWFKLEPPHVMITSMKRADSGPRLIARLLELGVGDTTALLALPAGNWKATRVDMVERNQGSLKILKRSGRQIVEIPLSKAEIATICIEKQGD